MLTTQLLNKGLYLIYAGKSILPINQQKQPYSAALRATGHISEEGKAAWKMLQTTPPDEEQLRTWLRFPECGLGLVTGKVSGIIALDADGEEGIARFKEWGIKPHTRSRSGGYHWYVTHPGWNVQTLQSKTGNRLEQIRGIDIRADGGYIILPPTVISSRPYTQLRDTLDIDSAAKLPETVQELLGLLHAPVPVSPASLSPLSFTPWQGERTLEEELIFRALVKVSGGYGRNASGFDLACQLRDNRFGIEEAKNVMCQYALQVPATNPRGEHAPYTVSEALHSLEEAYKAAPRQPWQTKTAPSSPPASPQQTEESVFDTLRRYWPTATDEERENYARCLVGSKKPYAVQFLAEMNHDTEKARQYIQRLREQNTVTPGLSVLKKLLDTKRITP